MKRLLLPLLAAIALPTAVNAETIWLLISSVGTHSMEKIEMESLEKLEETGYLWASKTNDLIKNPQAQAWTLQGRWKCIIGK